MTEGIIKTATLDGFRETQGGYSFSSQIDKSTNGMMPRWHYEAVDDSSFNKPTGFVTFNNDYIYTGSSGTSPIFRMYTSDTDSFDTPFVSFASCIEYCNILKTPTIAPTSTNINDWSLVFSADDGLYTTYQTLTGWDNTGKITVVDGGDCDFYNSIYKGFRPMIISGNTVIVGDGNRVATLNIDAERWRNSDIVFPEDWNVACMSESTNGTLFCINKGDNGIIQLYGASSDDTISSFTAKTGQIELNEKILWADSRWGQWYVITDRNIYWTNGYQVSVAINPFDYGISTTEWNIKPNGMKIYGNKMVISTSGSNKSGELDSIGGIYIYDFETKKFSYHPGMTRLGMDTPPTERQKTFIFDNNGIVGYYPHKKCFVCGYENPIYDLTYNSSGGIFELYNNTNKDIDNSMYISELIRGGYGEKTANKVIIKCGIAPYNIIETSNVELITGSIDVKMADSTRPLKIKSTIRQNYIAGENEIEIEATRNIEVGDEVFLVNGLGTSETRHIVDINETSKTITLNSGFGEELKNGQIIMITPFKLQKTISVLNEIKEEKVDIPTSVSGRSFYIKLLIHGGQTEIQNIYLKYNDRG